MRSARTQVVAGFKTRLELDVPAPRVAALAAGVAAAPNAVQLLPPLLSDVINNGCDTGTDCAGRSAAHVNGMAFCCKAACGRSCSVSASSVNGNVRAVCTCAATLQVELLRGPDGVQAPHGVALRL